MSIPNPEDKINLYPETVQYKEDGQVIHNSIFRKYYLAFLFILVALLSFGVGKLSSSKPQGGVRIEYDQSLDSAAVMNSPVLSVIASSNGKKYYYSGCKNTISTKNKITFATSQMAESAGYTLASGCKPK